MDEKMEKAKQAAEAFGAVLAVLEPEQRKRERVLAAVAILLELVPAHVVLNELGKRGL